VLTLSDNYGYLLDYVTFAQLLFYVLTVAAAVPAAGHRPDLEMPDPIWKRNRFVPSV
jgi:hypothetical protein